jgi:AmmeMemoRadiSam system radical SAM enzyme
VDGLTVGTRFWHRTGDGRVQCDVCPRACRLHEGQRGFCFVRMRQEGAIVLTTYGRSSGYCVDPIEKKPLNHFLPGSAVLSFGTAGCNLGCRFCQNWDISKSRETDTLADHAAPPAIAWAAAQFGCRSVAFTYNDPVIFLEYAIDVADACHQAGVKAVAVTARYMCPEPRAEFYRHIDAANVDLKGFTGDFYRRTCLAGLDPVLETLLYLRHETGVWLEITNLLIPGLNDSDAEIDALTRWGGRAAGPGRAGALHRVPPGLQDAGPAAHPAPDADPGPPHRPGQRPPLPLHRQRARPGRAEHPLPPVRRAADRARLVPAGRLAAHRRRPVRELRHAPARGVRRSTGYLGFKAAPSTDRHSITATTEGNASDASASLPTLIAHLRGSGPAWWRADYPFGVRSAAPQPGRRAAARCASAGHAQTGRPRRARARASGAAGGSRLHGGACGGITRGVPRGWPRPGGGR